MAWGMGHGARMGHEAANFECCSIVCCVPGTSGLGFSEFSVSSYRRLATSLGFWERAESHTCVGITHECWS